MNKPYSIRKTVQSAIYRNIGVAKAVKQIQKFYEVTLGHEFHNMVDGKGVRYKRIFSGELKRGDQSYSVIDCTWKSLYSERTSVTELVRRNDIEDVSELRAVRRPIKLQRRSTKKP